MTNSKCGEVTFCTQVGKRVYVLNCIYCSQICLQWEMFINHLEQEHNGNLNFEPIIQPETSKMPIKMEIPEIITDEPSASVHINKKQKMLDESLPSSSAFDDPLESENSTSEMCLESSIKVEQEEECLPNLNLFETEDNSSELTVEMDPKLVLQTTFSNNQEVSNSNFITMKDFNNFKKELKEQLQQTEFRIRNQIKEQPTTIKRVLAGVLEELKIAKTDDVIKFKSKPEVIPKEPFSSIEEFLKFDAEILHNEEKHFHLIQDFESQRARDLTHYVKLNLKRCFTDDVAQHMCWKGTEKKKAVRTLGITQALRTACLSKYNAEADLHFERICIMHFQYAKVRVEKKLNYISKVKPAL